MADWYKRHILEQIYAEGQKVLKGMKKHGIDDIRITCEDKTVERSYEEYERRRNKRVYSES